MRLDTARHHRHAAGTRQRQQLQPRVGAATADPRDHRRTIAVAFAAAVRCRTTVLRAGGHEQRDECHVARRLRRQQGRAATIGRRVGRGARRQQRFSRVHRAAGGRKEEGALAILVGRFEQRTALDCRTHRNRVARRRRRAQRA